MINGGVSFWNAAVGVPTRRPPLVGDRAVDVAVVGAGFTGLWTAYALKRAEPDLEVVVLEREYAGFGASGRNGGWLYGELAVDAARYGPGADRLRAAVRGAVDEVIATAADEGIDADIVAGGVLEIARTPAQAERARAYAEAEGRHWLTADQVGERIVVAGTRGGSFSPSGARIHPAKLVRGLARAVERLGVTLHEDTTVTAIDPHRVTTDRGVVRAASVLRGTEGFTAGLPGQRRTWLPMNSSMIVTEPLTDRIWDRIGWRGSEVVGDAAHAYLYAQRTADGRIALGGRGVPYRFGSRVDQRGRTDPSTVAGLTAALHEWFPDTRSATVAHAWCGVLGVPRDWCATVAYDASTGLGHAGGYAGSGVATSNLAGRTLADLALGRDTALTRLSWVDHTVRRWEPEPLRWLGVRAMYGLYRAADRRETRSGRSRTSRLARIGDRITGR